MKRVAATFSKNGSCYRESIGKGVFMGIFSIFGLFRPRKRQTLGGCLFRIIGTIILLVVLYIVARVIGLL
jgi:Na+/phosphate symporter